MRFQLVLVAAFAGVGLAAPNTIEKRLVERFEPPIVPRGCPGGGAGHAASASASSAALSATKSRYEWLFDVEAERKLMKLGTVKQKDPIAAKTTSIGSRAFGATSVMTINASILNKMPSDVGRDYEQLYPNNSLKYEEEPRVRKSDVNSACLRRGGRTDSLSCDEHDVARQHSSRSSMYARARALVDEATRKDSPSWPGMTAALREINSGNPNDENCVTQARKVVDP
ncbi:hypothetical protein EXIGLDRAFT_693033 [Exidia glandulosa HHB12029]|uniref:Uncharacterized protein n=1 Tax=Exidia glandulosa HHB12029 TaxID=1314781 RepID=A0A166MH05_EXIGL|nr:hypothetical protein EXIGLDRAFT_693033 [Exidia glandulosa HHB12029]